MYWLFSFQGNWVPTKSPLKVLAFEREMQASGAHQISYLVKEWTAEIQALNTSGSSSVDVVLFKPT